VLGLGCRRQPGRSEIIDAKALSSILREVHRLRRDRSGIVGFFVLDLLCRQMLATPGKSAERPPAVSLAVVETRGEIGQAVLPGGARKSPAGGSALSRIGGREDRTSPAGAPSGGL